MRITTTGQLRGKVVDAEVGKGLPNVLIYASGLTAVTDRDGEYSFPSLKPDKYFVQLDMASIGLNRVPSQPMPHEVVVKGGEEARLDLGVIRGTRVSGTVLIYAMKDTVIADSAQTLVVELGGHPNVVLELSNSLESHRRVTDNRGRFSFTGIRPGQWTLQVIEGNLPPNYYIERERLELRLAPGSIYQDTLKVLPRKRRIQILQEGQVLRETRMPERRRPTLRPVAPRPEPVVAAKPQPPTTQQVPKRISGTQFIVVQVPEELAYTIQMSSWAREEKAIHEAESLRKAFGYHTFVEKVTLPRLGVRYRVYVGRFSTRRIAELAAEEIKKKSFSP
jgi:cell division septation protein DedD